MNFPDPLGQIAAITETSDAAALYPATLTQTASYNNLNELTSLSGQARTYDLNGNLLSDGQRSYAWDAENRLVGISYPGSPGKATAFTYDGLDRRVAIGETPAGGGSATTTGYAWCGSAICQSRSPSGARLRSYYGKGEFVAGTPGQSLFYGLDQVGSVRRVFASASSAPAYAYDPYGLPLGSTTPATDFTYAGLLNHPASGLYLAQYRGYDPVAGRWLARDPLGETTDNLSNLYRYVQGDPINFVDPWGLQPYTGQTPHPDIPGGPWTPAGAGQKPGTFFGPKGQGQQICRYVPDAANNGPASAPDAYWKTKIQGQGGGWPDRYSLNGEPITPEEVHPGNLSPPAAPNFPLLPLPASVFLGVVLYSTPAY